MICPSRDLGVVEDPKNESIISFCKGRTGDIGSSFTTSGNCISVLGISTVGRLDAGLGLDLKSANIEAASSC